MSEAEERARSAGWEVGNADRLNSILTRNEDGTVRVEIELARLEELSGVCSPYGDGPEHYGHMLIAVLEAHDKLMDVLFDAYTDGYRAGAEDREPAAVK